MTGGAGGVDPRVQHRALAAVRILLGLMWLYNVGWKRAPDFGEGAGSGLYKYTKYAVDHPVFPPYSWVVENLVLPHFVPFGYTVLIAETALAVLLLTGTAVRLAALLGIAQSLAIGLSVAYAPAEWPWSYWLMVGAHVAILVSPAGRALSVDAVRAGAAARLLGRAWGVLAVLVGLYSVLLSLGDPLAARGPGLRSSDLSVSLGEYNLVGGLVLAVAGALLLAASLTGPRVLALAASVLAVLGALSLHVQLGFSDPLLGGTPTSAAALLAVAVVAAFAVPRSDSTPADSSRRRIAA
jgi:hypothetical protein